MFTIHLIEMPFNKIIIKEAQKVIVKKNPRKKSHQFVVFCLKCFFRKSFSAMHRKRYLKYILELIRFQDLGQTVL